MDRTVKIPRSLLLVFIVFVLTACAESGNTTDPANNSPTNPCSTNQASDTDTDGEGLSDCYEVYIGTSPASVDSDGDGLSDYDEVVTKAFDATIDNFRFNPRIADVPDIRVRLDSVPSFEVIFTDNSSVEQTRSHTAGSRTTKTLTNSFTYEQSVGEELSSTLSSTGGSGGFNVTSGTTYSQSQQETMSWTTDQSRENSQFRESTESETSQNGVSNTGGELSVELIVENLGDQVITLNSLTASAKQIDPNDPTKQNLIGSLDFDTSFGAFQSFPIVTESNPLPFKVELSLGKIYKLLDDSRNLTILPTTWDIVDAEGRSYTHALTNVNARAALIIIDYDGVSNREIERHHVATVTDFQKNRIGADIAMDTILRRNYTEGSSSATFTGSNSGVLSILDVVNDDSNDVNGRWVVIHNYLDTDSVTRISKTYDIEKGSYSLADMQLAAGEVLHFMYYQDNDNDGLGSREEFVHRTLDTDHDTDNDSLSDYFEIKTGWQIPVTGTQMRTVYSDPLAADLDNDTLGDGAEFIKGTNPYKRDTDNDGVLDNTDMALTVEDMQEAAFLPLSQSQTNDTDYNAGIVSTGTYEYTTDRFGVDNAALSFTTDAHSLSLSNVFPSVPENGASVALWIKVDPNLSSNGYSLYEHDRDLNSTAQFCWIYPAGFTIFGDGNDRHSIFPGQNPLFETLAFADWHFLVMVGQEDTINGGMKTFKVYYNGQLYGSRTHPTTDVEFTTNDWHFAGPSSYAVGLEQYRGAIDDIRFFSRSLDAEEVQLLYESQ